MKKQENGRSMVEMLGVLAIIGVLSVAGVGGYGIATRRMEANNIMDTALKFSSQGIGRSPATTEGDRAYVLLPKLKSAGMTASASVEDMSLKYSRRGKTVCVRFTENVRKQGDDGIMGAFKTVAGEYIPESCKLPNGNNCCADNEIAFVNEYKQ